MAGTSSRRTRPVKPEQDSIYNRKQPIITTNKKRPITRKRDVFRNNNNLITLLVVFCFVSFLIIIYYFVKPVNQEKNVHKLRIVTPFPAPKIMDLPQFQGEHKESLYWGTYRPQVYFGVRARTPRSLLAGLMWLGVKDGRYLMRHVCQDSDELGTYGWISHNGRDYGQQVIVDQGMTLTTSFLKSKGVGSGYGGDWAVRVDLQNDKSKLEEEALGIGHLFFYLADEAGNALSIARERLDTRDGSLFAFGSREDVGGWEMHLASEDKLEIHYAGFETPHMHNLTELVQGTLGAHARRLGVLQLPDLLDHSSNVLVFQISAKFPFKTDIAFVSGTGLKSSRVEDRVKSLTGNLLANQLNEKHTEFEQKYKKCFNLTSKVDSESETVGRAAIGNLLGGIGYFYGQSKIALHGVPSGKNGDTFVPYWPAELYTAVPSRSFFPRGFLWDEGFHQLLIWRWDIHICLDIIGHWLDLMNIDGWIPREQILGSEALSKVPDEFVPQHPTNANPPTLFLVLHDLVHSTKRNKFTATESKDISSFLGSAFVRLEAWFQWFNTTQAGNNVSSYYWHGRDKETRRELNSKEYQSMAEQLSNMEILNKVRLRWQEMKKVGSDYASRELVREVLETPKLRLVPHIGYVSLFPFIMKIIPPDSWILEKQLDLISNRSTLWTDYGLRSLAKTSSLYMKRNTEHDPPYWRGPIWINMNYLILSALHHYSREDGPYRGRAKAIYGDLRENLIRNVVKNYRQTGYLWEQYDQKNKGKGKGARPFTGWTSLVLLIMSESFDEVVVQQF
ncbi:hypothetical protein IFM89_014487 [Coptis chinensis]|uniref:Mannosyl-oligosaccharide glucosidase n=1 Tax=Coptis chinensis TaxID=261450 RepID=A0A835HHF0_9MAGN|nr:hypothetical protein IFM89_014487 [Coptis chinensis]